MDTQTAIEVVSRWIHVGTAIVLVGGSVFMRFVLMPAADSLPVDEHDRLRQRVIGRWKRYVHAGILLLLLTGFYNYLVVMLPRHRGQGLYHGLLGTKILLALVVFFLASALVGKSAAFEGLRQNRKRWLAITILLTAVIVAISGYLKVAVPTV